MARPETAAGAAFLNLRAQSPALLRGRVRKQHCDFDGEEGRAMRWQSNRASLYKEKHNDFQPVQTISFKCLLDKYYRPTGPDVAHSQSILERQKSIQWLPEPLLFFHPVIIVGFDA